VLGLLVTLLLVGVTLAVLLWAGTVFLQGYWYTEPNPDAYWQGPAAAGALTLFLLVWCLLDVNAAHGPNQPNEPYDTLFRFSAREEMDSQPAKRIWSVKKGTPEPVPYDRRRIGQDKWEYRDANDRPWSPLGVEAILIERDGEKMRFDLDMSADSGYATYVSPDGWAMPEYDLGRPSTYRFGRFFVNMLLNGLHFAVWFVCLWLLLRFQWSHALGLAFVLWLVMTLVVVPILMIRCGEVAREGATAAATTWRAGPRAGPVYATANPAPHGARLA
jgi:hypothetical protein